MPHENRKSFSDRWLTIVGATPTMSGPNTSVPISLRPTAMAWVNSIVAFFRHKAKIRTLNSGGGRTAFRLRSWLVVLLFAAIVQYLRRTTSLISFDGFRGGVPVQLTHGNESAHVTDGVTMLDIIKRCPSLYGESAKYVAPWWLSSCVLELHCNTSFSAASSTSLQR